MNIFEGAHFSTLQCCCYLAVILDDMDRTLQAFVDVSLAESWGCNWMRQFDGFCSRLKPFLPTSVFSCSFENFHQFCIFHRHNSRVIMTFFSNKEFNEDTVLRRGCCRLTGFLCQNFTSCSWWCVQANEIQTALWFQSRPVKCAKRGCWQMQATSGWGISLKVQSQSWNGKKF